MLSQVTYELVEGDYWFGKYGPFKVIIHSKSGYVNATKLCFDGGKHFYHWRNNVNSKDLIQEVASRLDNQALGIPWGPVFEERDQIVLVNGTYAHPLLIPHIASWCSAKFAIAVSEIVNHYIVSTFQWYIENLVALNFNLTWDNQNLQVNNQQLMAENQDLQSGAEMDAHILEQSIAPRVVPQNRIHKKDETFSLYRVDKKKYYAIRCQHANLLK